MKYFNTILCGVGGTGVIGFGSLLKTAGLPQGYNVVGSETRGSAQRGGTVTSSVRYFIPDKSEKVGQRSSSRSPAIPVGGADLMIATEAAESLRQAIYLNEHSKVIINHFFVEPKPGNRNELKNKIFYPSMTEIQTPLKNITPYVYSVEASEISLKLYGSYLYTNPILLGVALQVGGLPIDKKEITSLLKSDEAIAGFEEGLALKVANQG